MHPRGAVVSGVRVFGPCKQGRRDGRKVMGIQIILLTGFLGAGKTTLMERLLDTYKDERIGVIINDFGKVNVDAKLIRRDGIEMAELSNGSVFCACIKDKFVDGLIDMSTRDLNYVFIEASGLSDPSNMEAIVRGIKKETNDRYNLLGSIAVIDGVSFIAMKDVLPALERQVEYADAVILNKMDLIEEGQIEEIKSTIISINPRAKIYPGTYCDVSIKTIAAGFSSEKEGRKESQETTNTIESRAVTFVVKGQEPVGKASLRSFLEAIAPSTYRMKGFALTSEGLCQISCVGEMVGIIPWNREAGKQEAGKQETEIVVISAVGIRLMSDIARASAEFVEGRLQANV